LQQAVAKVESGLDTILADEDDRQAKDVPANTAQAEQPSMKTSTSIPSQLMNKSRAGSMLSAFSPLVLSNESP